jgi:hypothetical protein
MARTDLFALTVFALVGCSQPKSLALPSAAPVDWASYDIRSTPDAGRPSPTSAERAIAGTYLTALESPNLEGLGALLDEHVHFTFAGMHDRRGRTLVIDAHHRLFDGFDRRHIRPSRVLLTDNMQVIEWTMNGFATSSKKPVRLNGVLLLSTNDDGSIGDVYVAFDEALAAAQGGSAPKGFPSVITEAPAIEGFSLLEQAASVDEAANVAVVRTSLDRFEEFKEREYLETFADDVDVTPLVGPSLHGHADLKNYQRQMQHAIANLDSTTDNAWGIGDFVVVQYHIVGEQRGPLGWIASQRDRLLKMFIVDVIEMRDHKIKHVWRYDNPSQIITELP